LLPILQASLQTDTAVALPATISVQLTWTGTLQSANPISYSTTGFASGDVLTVAAQVSSKVQHVAYTAVPQPQSFHTSCNNTFPSS
jgi:hypothetical protein